jgi:hypothetical protein
MPSSNEGAIGEAIIHLETNELLLPSTPSQNNSLINYITPGHEWFAFLKNVCPRHDGSPPHMISSWKEIWQMQELADASTYDEEWEIVQVCRRDIDEERVIMHMFRRNYRKMYNRQELLKRQHFTPDLQYSIHHATPVKSHFNLINSSMECRPSRSQEIESLEYFGIKLTKKQEESLSGRPNQLHEQDERLHMLRVNHMKEVDYVTLQSEVRRRLF